MPALGNRRVTSLHPKRQRRHPPGHGLARVLRVHDAARAEPGAPDPAPQRSKPRCETRPETGTPRERPGPTPTGWYSARKQEARLAPPTSAEPCSPSTTPPESDTCTPTAGATHRPPRCNDDTVRHLSL